MHAHARAQNFDRHETSLPPTAPSYCLCPSVRPFVRRPSVGRGGPSSLSSPFFLSPFRPCLILGATTSFTRPHCSGSDTLSLATAAAAAAAVVESRGATPSLRPTTKSTLRRRRRSFSKWDRRGRGRGRQADRPTFVRAFVRQPTAPPPLLEISKFEIICC